MSGAQLEPRILIFMYHVCSAWRFLPDLIV
jgi:hypothetical protein